MWFWLSHELNENTQGYRGVKSLKLQKTSKIEKGDSSNSHHFEMNNHLGSHVDFPYHFISDGKTISEYDASEWVFSSPIIIDLKCIPGQKITPELIKKHIKDGTQADIILIKTGLEKYRGTNTYWDSSPIFTEELCAYFVEKFNTLKAIGFDSISLSSLMDREQGRIAHKILLSNDIRIFEDLKLSNVNISVGINKVIALPLRIEQIDGSPLTIIAE